MIKKKSGKCFKITLIIAMICCFMTSVPVEAVSNGTIYPITTDDIQGWPKGPEVACETAVLIEADSGLVLYNKGMNELRYPASITKILTALLTIENTSLDTQVTFSETAVAAEQIAGSSTIHMLAGETITIKDCLYGLMIQSANEVAVQLAEVVSGSESAFAELMNQKAAEFGCKNTHFTNASGLPDENHYTTAYDMALIFREALKNDTFREVISAQNYIIPATNMTAAERSMHTHHPLMATESPEYYEGCIGGKSGSTEAAGKTLVTGAEKNGKTYIAVVMKGADMGPNCLDTRNLFDYGFESFEKVELEEGYVIVPKGVTVEQLEATEEVQSDGRTLIRYTFAGQEVGSAYKKEKEQQVQTEPEEQTETGGVEDTKKKDLKESPNMEQKGWSLMNILIILMAAFTIVLIVLLAALIRHDRKKKRRKKRKNKTNNKTNK